MTRPVKLLSVMVILYTAPLIAVYLVFSFPEAEALLRVLVLLCVLIPIGIYASDMAKNPNLTQEAKKQWGLAIFLLSAFAIPVYWAKYGRSELAE